MTPKAYIFWKAGWLFKTNKISVESETEKPGITTIYFKVGTHKVRLNIERISPNIYVKNFTCDCDDGRDVKHNNICSHICAAITYYSIGLAYKKIN